jgi:ABC-type nickel/cobalt efflux system permease component RcnA
VVYLSANAASDMIIRGFVFALIILIAADPGQAHPVPRRNHDRTITVRLSVDPAAGQVRVIVDYRLEVDPFTVVFDDLPALGDRVNLKKLRTPQEFYETYLASYAPILAANLVASLDQQPVEFGCASHLYTLFDEQGAPLNHLRCEFRFEAKPTASLRESVAQGEHRFRFAETNYEFEEGFVRLSLAKEAGIHSLKEAVPSPELQKRPAAQLAPGDEKKLRNLDITFTATVPLDAEGNRSSIPAELDQGAPSPSAANAEHGLLGLLLDSRQGFWILMVLAAGFGAAHALTPGHGKTLVAAYLVGERGTAAHAVLLGAVTTLTHTGAVLALAAGLLFLFPGAVPRDVQTVLGLVGGILVAGMGLWLLLRRLTGGADHVHIGGHGHHHHHGFADHYHDAQGHAHPLPSNQSVSAWNLVLLGIVGGMVPCWDAILMLGLAISAQRLWLGLPLLLAFSAGLAGVLIAVGLAVVYAKGFASSRWGESRLFRTLPLASALLVTAMGLWLCYDTLHLPPPAADVSAVSRP